MIQLGLRLHDAVKLPIEELIPHVKAQGYTCAHLALSKVMTEHPSTPGALTPGYANYLRGLFNQHHMDIALLGSYYNLAHPDSVVIKDFSESYFAHIRFASLLGCGMVGTETGAPNRENEYTPECRSDKALSTFISNLKPVVRCAEQYGVTIAIEPAVSHIVWNAKRCRQVLDEIGSHNLQVLFDPVNFLELDNIDAREDIITEAMDLLCDDMAMIHLKDFVRSDEGFGLKAVGAGTGEMDYTKIMKFIKSKKPYIYATLENTTPENAVFCRNAMQKAYDEA